MRRPGVGTKGRPINVRVNYFLFDKFPEFNIHQYDVVFSPEMKSRPRRRLLIRQLEAEQPSLGGALAYDGVKILYTPRELSRLKPDGYTVRYVEEGEEASRGRDYVITLKPSAVIQSNQIGEYVAGRQLSMPHELLQALDVVLSQRAHRMYIPGARGNFFDLSFGPPVDLTGGLATCKGEFRSVRFTQKGLAMNLDTVTTAMIKPVTLLEHAAVTCLSLPGGAQQLATQGLDAVQRARVSRMIKGLRATADVGGKHKYRIGGLTRTRPVDEKFESPKGSGKMISVQEYYLQQYKYKLKCPNLPCVMVGNEKRRVLVPMEALRMSPGQRAVTKLNRDQVTNMLRAACQRPPERFSDVDSIARRLDLRSDPYAQPFHLQIQGKPMEARARVLDPPKLCFGNKTVAPQAGQWNMTELKVLQGASVRCWAALALTQGSRFDSDGCEYLLRNLVAGANLIGMKMGKPVTMVLDDARNAADAFRRVVDQSRQKIQGEHLQLVVVLFPGIVPAYLTVKRLGNCDLGVVTQGMDVGKHIRKDGGALEQAMVNIALKMNAKLGGRNFSLSPLGQRPAQEHVFGALLAAEPTIMFGADVTHPTGREVGIPSVAAMVANVDWPTACIYRALTKAQAKREEMITAREEMVREHLTAFKARNGVVPRRVIYYRDGVSEGQFNMVLLHEVQAIFAAWQALGWEGFPRVTFVVVQKRHHVRMAPIPPDQGSRPSGNLPPGTVVDQDVCNPVMFDFWLLAHIGLQGTSRPTRYCVLYDDNRLKPDEIQGLTHALCYTYARCTRSVSVVPLVYYADLAAYKARDLVKELELSDSESVVSGASGQGPTQELPAYHPNVMGDIMNYA